MNVTTIGCRKPLYTLYSIRNGQSLDPQPLSKSRDKGLQGLGNAGLIRMRSFHEVPALGIYGSTPFTPVSSGFESVPAQSERYELRV